jgi:hypothetical protein
MGIVTLIIGKYLETKQNAIVGGNLKSIGYFMLAYSLHLKLYDFETTTKTLSVLVFFVLSTIYTYNL